MILQDLELILAQADIPVAHYEITANQSLPYIVYQEIKTGYDYAGGRPIREKITVMAMHFTSRRFDPSLEKLKEALHDARLFFSIDHDYDESAKIVMGMFTITLINDLESGDIF